MNDEQIKEAMRLADDIRTAHTSEWDVSDLVEAQNDLEAYLRTIGEPENTFPLNPNGSSKWAHLQKHDGAEAIGVVFRTGSGSVGSLVDGRVVWADWLAHPNGSKPESVNAELLEALKDARHCIGIDRDTLVDCHTNPCTGYLDPDGALAKAEYDDVIDAADAAIARAESAIETPTKVRDDPKARWRIDAALSHVVQWAYMRGRDDAVRDELNELARDAGLKEE